MVGADLRQWSFHPSQSLGTAMIPVPNSNLPAQEVHALIPFPTSSSSSSGIHMQHAANVAFQGPGLSNNGVFTQQTREYTNQSSDTAIPNSINTLLSKDALQNLLRSVEAMNLPQFSRQPQASSIPPEQVRRTLMPVLLKNVQRRSQFDDNFLAKVEVGLRDALTDQLCDSLSQKLLTINGEIQATRGSEADGHAPATVSNHLSSLATVTRPDEQTLNTHVPTTPYPVRELPRAPRSMRSASSAGLTSQTVESSVSSPKCRRRDTYDFGGLGRRSSEQEPPGSALSARERRFSWHRPLQQHELNGSFTMQPRSTSHVKREYPGASRDGSSPIGRMHRSRSPRRRSLSPSLHHSRHDASRRRFSQHDTSMPNPHHSRSPPCRRSCSRSPPRKAHFPPSEPRPHVFSPRLSRPPGSHRSISRPRKNSFARRQQLPPAHVGRSRDGSFRHRSPEPAPRRRTPVQMRSIDRTRPSPPHRRDSTLDGLGLSISHISRSPGLSSAVDNLSGNHPSPSRHKHSRSPDPASDRHRLLPSPTRIRLRSPVHVSFPRHGPLLLSTCMQAPRTHARERSPDRDSSVSTSVPNHERPAPQGLITVKREPDIEDFTVVLHSSPSTMLSPAVVPSSYAPSSPQPGSVSPMNISPALPSQVPVAPTHPPPVHVSPDPQSMIDINSAVQEPGHLPDVSEEDRNESPPSVERGAGIPSSPVPSSLPVLPEDLPIQLPPPQELSVLPSLSIPSQPSQPPSCPSMAATQRFTVPGLWFAKHGQNQADILDCEFEVNSEIVQKWYLPGSSTPKATAERLSLQLLCIPVELLENTCQISSLHELVDSGALTVSMPSMKTVWPEQGSLLVQMNPTKPHKRSWFPEDMGPSSPSLDVTDSVHEGKNVLRLIQLEDMTNKIFMLQALLLPPTSQEDNQTYWDIKDLNLADHLATGNLSPATVEVI